jgi:ADP-ribose pyrophosphatase
VRVLGEGRWLRLVDRDGWEHVERLGSSGVVVILAVTDENKILLVEQPRPAVGGRVLEPPAGLVGDVDQSESAAVAAKRELLEETGYRASHVEFVLECPSSPGSLAESYTFYRATGLVREGPGGGDGSENITVHEVPVGSAMAYLNDQAARGIRFDTKTLAALYLLGVRLEP